MSNPNNQNPLKTSLLEATRSAKANIVPGIFLWFFACALVFSYYNIPAFRSSLTHVAAIKNQFGFYYSAFAAILFGAIIPFVYLRINFKTRNEAPWNFLPFYIGFWAYRGVEVDIMYRIQALLFGTAMRADVIISKVVVDQFVYNPFWGVPITIVLFAWRDSGFNIRCAKKSLTGRIFLKKVLVLLISQWLVWIPAVAAIYSFPMDLQIPLFNIVLCLWSLILAVITSKTVKPELAGSE